MPKLGVNIDHIATLRQARRGSLPDPVQAALLCEKAGANSIVAHLREDRRHIQDSDVKSLVKRFKNKFNLEMSVSPEILKIACKLKPYQATLVPEKRKELTTEGGLDVAANFKKISKAVKLLQESGIRVSLFIDPDNEQIDHSLRTGAGIIELHTGGYADAKNNLQKNRFFIQLKSAVNYALSKGLVVNAGHGLDYENLKRIARIKGIEEFNIGYSIISRAVFTGLSKAVKDMLKIIK
ncbi:MAG: pyridoxine 5'-phosphate synthase [Candidatus Omnitrophota bacterium]